jgi:hypothetical protein
MILHKANDTTAFFWCPGCDEAHQIHYAGEKAWGFNNDWDKPTFTPSYLTWADPNPKALPDPQFQKYRDGFRCHSYITNGQIAFLGDCTHALADQTVDLPPWPYDEA